MPFYENEKGPGMDTTYARNCPVCESDSKEPLYRQVFADVKKVSFLKGYDVVVCNRCGFAFADNIPSQKAFDRYYQRQSKYEKPESSVNLSRLGALENGLEFISTFVKNIGVPILEIGCGSGDFLRYLQEKGFANLTAMEPSPQSVNSLRRELGIQAIEGSISHPESGQTYDLVMLLTVLEHVVDLEGALKNISALLNSGGLLFIRVPDVCRFPDFDDSPFQQFSPEHINYFSTVSTANLLARHGYTLRKTQEIPLRESDDSILPMINLMFRKSDHKNEFTPGKDAATRTQLKKYIDASMAKERSIQEKIEPFAISQEPIIVWGVGTHTLRLLELGALKKCNIAAFIDSNTHYEGGLFNNVPVHSPGELHKYPHKILISSKVFQTEISDVIRNKLKAPNELILLYSRTADGDHGRKAL
jgi:2-polyprenyl-3-methyl-5-hydroxy-6-metoxy-1,4-benzoquinol methylase